MKFRLLVFVWCCVVFLSPVCCSAEGVSWSLLEQRLAQDGFDAQWIAGLFSRWEVRFDPRVMPRKITHKESKLDYSQYLAPHRIRSARDFLNKNIRLLSEVEDKYAVPREIVVAILLVETNFGKTLGNAKVFNVFSSMALAKDFSAVEGVLPTDLLEDRDRIEAFLKRKSEWAYEELKALLTFSKMTGADPLGFNGSIFGAFGICQFIPSSILRYGVDFDGNGRIDLFSLPDAAASASNYLKENGWQSGLSAEERAKVVYSYNHSEPYVKTVLAVAKEIGLSQDSL